MSVTVSKIKRIVTDAGQYVADARVASFRTGFGFTVTQQRDVPQKYIIISPRAKDEDGAAKIHAGLRAAGIKFGYHLGLTYIHPEQIED